MLMGNNENDSENMPLILIQDISNLLGLNSFLARGNFCHPLITFANSLDPYQDRHSIGPDLDLMCLTL